MEDALLEKIIELFASHPEVKLAYFFGSRATGTFGPMSDFDFAFFVDEISKEAAFDLRLKLMDEIGRALKNDNIDVVCLNFVESPELKYAIIKDGKLIVDQEPYRVLVEPKIMNEYFDFIEMLRRNNLTKG